MSKNLKQKLKSVRSCDYFYLKHLLDKAKSNQERTKIEQKIDASILVRKNRKQSLPKISYPKNLPVSARSVEIVQAIKQNQVVVVCGETGSGKTTQLPKICLEAGRGIDGLIGHTQPRRLAARTVANRLAEELESEVGKAVGFKVRHTDKTNADTYIKLMTDGILLAELQQDRFLNQYDTIIIDEAHERSLNIDFLLGYIKNLLKKRRDLKVIITSATIDVERFSKHFDDAPVIEVSGRTYPVEVRYRPLLEEAEETHHAKIIEAINELSSIDLGDILIFLEGEGEIHEVDKLLRKQNYRNTEILPLYARLSSTRQNKIFQTHNKRHIVLATNVAETSLTIPGIRYVIDKGDARISRYSYKSKVQRLPIEKVSQASANQRKGRCGRVSEGICIRLFSEEDYESRRVFTEPEITRTNLASVILQMMALRLGEIEEFPFLDPPDNKFISDGKRLLLELGAINHNQQLTKVGQQMVRLPVDPRYARILIAANEWNCLNEILIIISGLSIQSPKERPMDMQEKADSAHAAFNHENSDFLWFLNVWNFFQQQQKKLSQNQLRKLCKTNFLSYVRMMEWIDIHHQLKQSCQDLQYSINSHNASYANIHCALSSGLLSHIGFKAEANAYEGARGTKHYIFPGSSQFHKKPNWYIAAEIIETSKTYARTIAHIEVNWLLKTAAHLLKHHYSDAAWDIKSQCVMANERISLYGLTLVANKRVNYGKVDAKQAHEIFIREGVLQEQFSSSAGFYIKNQKVIAEVRLLEKKSRRPDVLDEEKVYEFYKQHLPEDVYDAHTFAIWNKSLSKETQAKLLINKDDLMRHEAEAVNQHFFPDKAVVNGIELPIEYEFEPGKQKDGIHLDVSIESLNQISMEKIDFLVPGLLEEKVIFMIKELPKSQRKQCVPVPDTAQQCLDELNAQYSLAENLSQLLFKFKGIDVKPKIWSDIICPIHLQINFRLLGLKQELLAESRNLNELKELFSKDSTKAFKQLTSGQYEEVELKEAVFDELLISQQVSINGKEREVFSGLEYKNNTVFFRYFESSDEVYANLERSLQHLFLLALDKEIRYLKKNLPAFETVKLLCAKSVYHTDIWHDFIMLLVDMTCMQAYEKIITQELFEKRLEDAKKNVLSNANILLDNLSQIMFWHDKARNSLQEIYVSGESANAYDIDEQLQWLVYDGFLQETPVNWLVHYTRYLKGVLNRLEKLKTSFLKDTQKMEQVSPHWEKAKLAFEKMQETGIHSKTIEEFRWWVEEFRVSLFAQELKTISPISSKRLDKLWQTLQKESY